MLFSESERHELAAFFAKRFSDPTVRAMLAKRAGVKEADDDDSPNEAWDSLILQAQRRRKLSRLALVASKMDQSDQNLQAVCNLLGARARAVRNRTIAGGLAATLALGFGFGGWMIGSDEPQNAEPELAQVVEVAPEPVAAFVVPEAPPAKPLSKEEARKLAKEAEKLARAEAKAAKKLAKEQARAAEKLARAEAKAAKKLAKEQAKEARRLARQQEALAREEARKNRPPYGPAWRNGRCTYDKPGQFVGYWYAGKEHPGSVGEVIDIGVSVNVRQDHPSSQNGYNTKAPVRCILRRGDKVKLTGAAIEVSRGHYWVPLYHGDLIAEAKESVAAL